MHANAVGDFHACVLNSLTEQIAVIDAQGTVQWVNRAWMAFSEDGDGALERTWRATNYRRGPGGCAAQGEEEGSVVSGIEAVIRGERPIFSYEYPCHFAGEQHWFMMRIHPLDRDGADLFVVTHRDITERKLAELRVAELAVQDGLTGIANRRRFDAFLGEEWRRARRPGNPVSLALFDVDHFKSFNDSYGHMAGDDCLRRVGEVLKVFSRRPGDLAARYGGDEFAVILGNTGKEDALEVARRIRAAVQAMNVRHERGVAAGRVTISVGVATLYPHRLANLAPEVLVDAADHALYEAKACGRDQVCAYDQPIPAGAHFLESKLGNRSY